MNLHVYKHTAITECVLSSEFPIDLRAYVWSAYVNAS